MSKLLLEVSGDDVERLTGVLNYMAEQEQDDFISWLDMDDAQLAEGVVISEWAEDVNKLFEADMTKHESDSNYRKFEELVDKLATTSTGHIYCDVVRLQNNLGV